MMQDQQMSQEHDLGRIEAVYTQTLLSYLDNPITAVIGIGFIGLIMASHLLPGLVAWIPLYAVVGVVFGVGFYFYRRWSRPRARLVMYERGLVIDHPKGGPIVVELAKVKYLGQKVTRQSTGSGYTGGGTITIIEYHLSMMDGRRVSIPNIFPNPNTIGKIIGDKIADRITQRLIDAYHAGEEVEFGAMTVSSYMGLKYKGQVYYWRELETISIESDVIKLYKRGIIRKLVPIPTFLDTSPVENVVALKRLLKTITDIVRD